jgi:hypothetical protein
MGNMCFFRMILLGYGIISEKLCKKMFFVEEMCTN